MTQRTRVAQRTSGAEHSVYRARFWQDRVAAAPICQEGTRQEQTGPRKCRRNKIPFEIASSRLTSRICIGIGTCDGPYDG